MPSSGRSLELLSAERLLLSDQGLLQHGTPVLAPWVRPRLDDRQLPRLVNLVTIPDALVT